MAYGAPKPRICAMCGETFPGYAASKYCPGCRPIRQKAMADAANKRNRSRREAGEPVTHLGDIRKCAKCGRDFWVAAPTQKYCPDCAPQPRADAAMRKCVICGAEFKPRMRAQTCSPACHAELARQINRRNYEERKKSRPHAVKKPRPPKPAPSAETVAARAAKIKAYNRDYYYRVTKPKRAQKKEQT